VTLYIVNLQKQKINPKIPISVVGFSQPNRRLIIDRITCTPTFRHEPVTETGKYKDTVNLPKTNFDMRANAIKREPEIQKFWAENNIYSQLAENNPGELFILHDGPPYANGQLHIGHALNKILKDIINRYQLLKGRKIRYVPGWDCHGLPIEFRRLGRTK
jgi:isoleucyl-tRNA synthetase